MDLQTTFLSRFAKVPSCLWNTELNGDGVKTVKLAIVADVMNIQYKWWILAFVTGYNTNSDTPMLRPHLM